MHHATTLEGYGIDAAGDDAGLDRLPQGLGCGSHGEGERIGQLGTGSLGTGSPAFRPVRQRVAVYCLAAVICSFISLPVLPAAALARFPAQKINYDLGEEIGWPTEVRLLAGVWHSLPSSERVRTTLLAGNYGEAGPAEAPLADHI